MTAHSSGRVHVDLQHLLRMEFRVQGLDLRAARSLHSNRHGARSSPRRGRGMDFEELRSYVAGDDIRHIDWKASARKAHAQLRVYREERDRSVWLLVNQAPSMFFGSVHNTKAVSAVECAALCAWRAAADGDRVGAMLFDHQGLEVIAPQRSRAALLQLLARLSTWNRRLHSGLPTTAPALLNTALERLMHLVHHDAQLWLIGDGLSADRETLRRLDHLRRHNDCVVALVHDPLERALPHAGTLMISDGSVRQPVDLSQVALREAHAEAFRQRLAAIAIGARRRGMRLLQLDCAAATEAQLRRLLGRAHTEPATVAQE